MSRPRLPTWTKIAGIGVPATSGGSWLITLAGVPKTTAIVIAAALLAVTSIATAIAYALPRIAESIAMIAESIQEHKANILKARCEVITAENEAEISRSWAKTYNKIAEKGLESSEKAEQAERMLRMLAISPGLKEEQRLPDDVLDRHLTPPPKNRTTVKKPSLQPKGSSGGSGVVVPFQSADDDLCGAEVRGSPTLSGKLLWSRSHASR
jgi:hypothetical protein